MKLPWRSRKETATPSMLFPDKKQNGEEECILVNFVGLLLLQGATEKRQIRYTMDILCPESRQKLEVSKRFDQYQLLRKQLLKICVSCHTMYQVLAATPFPKTYWRTTLQHVHERALPLEKFMQTVLDVSLAWTGCTRTKKAFQEAVSQFLGLPVTRRPATELDFRSLIRQSMLAKEETSANEPRQVVQDEEVAGQNTQKNSETRERKKEAETAIIQIAAAATTTTTSMEELARPARGDELVWPKTLPKLLTEEKSKFENVAVMAADESKFGICDAREKMEAETALNPIPATSSMEAHVTPARGDILVWPKQLAEEESKCEKVDEFALTGPVMDD
jgi:hypothetical protein